MAILELNQMRKVLQSALDDARVAHAVDFSVTVCVKYQLLRIQSGLSERELVQIHYYICMHNVLKISVNLTC